MSKLVKLSEYVPYGKHTIYEEDISVVVDILKYGWLTQGKKIDEFEASLANYIEVEHAIAVNNGTSALYLAYLVNGVNPKSNLITTPLTFLATVNAAKMLGSDITLVDIDPHTWNLSEKLLSEEKKYSHVVPVHFAGLPNEMEKIQKISNDNDAIIIEDAAHAVGAEYKGNKIGSNYSKSAIFSFHPVKHIAAGEGGAIVTNDPELANKLRMMRSHGIMYNDFTNVKKDEKPYYYEMHELSLNFRMPDILCGLAMSQLSRIEDNINERNRQAKLYRDLIDDWGQAIYQETSSYKRNAYHIFPIKFHNLGIKKRDHIFRELRNLNVGVQIHYIPVHLHPFYHNINRRKLPNTMDYYENSLTLPLYPGLDDEIIKTIFGNIKILFSQVSD